MSRTRSSFRNAGTAAAGQLLNNGIRFVCRTVFIYTIGREYLGISSLYSNILTILSISELGIGSAVTYSLYKPLAEGDHDAVRSYMAFFRKAYRIIGAFIFLTGLALMPVLPRIMNGVTDKVNIYLYYLLYLAQTAVSYLFFAYKGVLLDADQKKYLQDIVGYCVQTAVSLIQIAVLLALRAFLLYTVLAVGGNIVKNITVAVMADRRYPWLAGDARPVSGDRVKQLFYRVYAMFFYRVCTAVGTSIDNILISAYISTDAVGLYDNYHMVIQIFQHLMTGIFRSVTSVVGNLYLMSDRSYSEFVFRSMNLLNNWMITVCSVCFLVMFQPFITLWIGEEYLLPEVTLLVIVLNFATNYLQNVVQIYKDATGLFVRGKYRAAATLVMNLVLSVLLVKRFGIAGVLGASIISRMATTWLYDGWLVYRHGFGMTPFFFYRDSMVTVLVILFFFGVNRLVPSGPAGWVRLIGRGAVFGGMSFLVFWLLSFRTREYAYLMERARTLAGRKRR